MADKRKYELTVIHADGVIERTTTPAKPELSLLQSKVGGLIESVPHWASYNGRRAQVWCNEEGRINGLPLNTKATELWLSVLGKGPFSYPPQLFGDVLIVQKEAAL